jgi:hypothetical protein
MLWQNQGTKHPTGCYCQDFDQYCEVPRAVVLYMNAFSEIYVDNVVVEKLIE